MREETFFDSIKRNLNGEPGQPIVLGVCKTLAALYFQGSESNFSRRQDLEQFSNLTPTPVCDLRSDLCTTCPGGMNVRYQRYQNSSQLLFE